MADRGDNNSEDDSPHSRLQSLLTYMSSSRTESNTFDTPLLASLTLLSTNPTHTVFALTVPITLCNQLQNLHGGATATAFDICTSVAIFSASREGFWDAGHVSRTLNVSYVRPVPAGSEVLLECEIVGLGKRVGLVRGVMRMKGEGGKIVATCEHHKVALGVSL